MEICIGGGQMLDKAKLLLEAIMELVLIAKDIIASFGTRIMACLSKIKQIFTGRE